MAVKKYWVIINDKYQPELLEDKTWDDIKDLPKYNCRSFKNKEEAETVFKKLSAADLEPDPEKAEKKIEEKIANLQDDQVMIFTDGSYKDEEPKKYGAGWGYVSLHKENGKLSEYSDHYYILNADSRQVNGEVEAVNRALMRARSSHLTKVDLYCDFLNLILWDSGFYKATEDVSKDFVKFMKDYHTELDITFHWSPSHNGIVYNDKADVEAKAGFDESPTEFELYGELDDLQEQVARWYNTLAIDHQQDRYDSDNTEESVIGDTGRLTDNQETYDDAIDDYRDVEISKDIDVYEDKIENIMKVLGIE